MADIVFVAIVIGFFAAAAGFVLLCDRIIGPDQAAVVAPAPRGEVVEPATASAA